MSSLNWRRRLFNRGSGIKDFKRIHDGRQKKVYHIMKKILLTLHEHFLNRTITRLLEGILFICGPSSIICARAERGCK